MHITGGKWTPYVLKRPDFFSTPVFQAHVEGRGFDWATVVFSLSQFTKARSVHTLGPFSLASLETGFVMALDCQRPAVEPCIHQNDARVHLSPCAPPPQVLGGYRRGV